MAMDAKGGVDRIVDIAVDDALSGISNGLANGLATGGSSGAGIGASSSPAASAPALTAARRASITVDPLWSSIVDAFRNNLGVDLADDLLGALTPLERTRDSIRVTAPVGRLPRWMSDARLAALVAAVAQVADGAYGLALLPTPESADPGMDPTLSLRRFIASPANQSACAVAGNLVDVAGGDPSLLRLHGPAGSGKTHLLQGIAQGLVSRGLAPVISLDADGLSNALITSLRSDRLDAFRAELRAARAVLIDDLEQLSGRDATQDELLEALDPLFGNGALVLIASRTPIDQLEGLRPRLRERLTAARAFELVTPAWEARVAIVLERIAAWHVDAPQDVGALIANLLGENLSSLDVRLTRLMAHPGAVRGLYDGELVRRTLSEDAGSSAPLSPDLVIDHVTRHFNLRVADLRSPSRSPRLTTPRQIGMYLLRRHCGLSYPEIGQCFDRHHTTAMHACRRIEERREKQSGLRSTVGVLEKELLRLADEVPPGR